MGQMGASRGKGGTLKEREKVVMGKIGETRAEGMGDERECVLIGRVER